MLPSCARWRPKTAKCWSLIPSFPQHDMMQEISKCESCVLKAAGIQSSNHCSVASSKVPLDAHSSWNSCQFDWIGTRQNDLSTRPNHRRVYRPVVFREPSGQLCTIARKRVLHVTAYSGHRPAPEEHLPPHLLKNTSTVMGNNTPGLSCSTLGPSESVKSASPQQRHRESLDSLVPSFAALEK